MTLVGLIDGLAKVAVVFGWRTPGPAAYSWRRMARDVQPDRGDHVASQPPRGDLHYGRDPDGSGLVGPTCDPRPCTGAGGSARSLTARRLVTFGPHTGVTFPLLPSRHERRVGGMDEMRDGPVVVGFDPSPAAARAMDVAAEEASAAGVPLVVAHVYGWPILYASLANIPFAAEDWRPAPEAVAAAESAAARSGAPIRA